jgi:hypothetical protein
MNTYKFKQTFAQLQAIIDKAEALPTKAELDYLLFYKVDKDFSFGTVDSGNGDNVLTFSDGTTTWLVGDVDSDTGIFVHDTINLGTGYGYDLISQRTGGWPWNENGCKEAEAGKALNVPINGVMFQNRGIGDIAGEDQYEVVGDLEIGEQVACGQYLTSGEMICNIKWQGHVIPGWYALIFAGTGTSVYIFENKD